MQNNSVNDFWDKVEKWKIFPIPMRFFILKEKALRIIVAFGAMIGAATLSVIYFLCYSMEPELEQDYAIQFFRSSFFNSIVYHIPYLWLVAILVISFVSLFAVKMFKGSYLQSKFKLVSLFLISMAVLSVGMNFFHVGRRIHRYLMEHVTVYFHLINSEEAHWTQPEMGRMGGRIIANLDGQHLLLVKSYHDGVWHIDIEHARTVSRTALVPGTYLKIVGVRTGEREFRAEMVMDRSIPYNK